jgi:predicted DNA-binding transcriptional regulator AlpA
MSDSSSPSKRDEALRWSASTTAQALGIGRRTLWGRVAQQRFPAPDLALGPGCDAGGGARC